MKFGKHFVGYIHKDHLTALWDTPEDYSVGDDLLARVLYVLPTVKFVYLSLKKELCNPEANCAPPDTLKVGNVVRKAKVSLNLSGISGLRLSVCTHMQMSTSTLSSC